MGACYSQSVDRNFPMKTTEKRFPWPVIILGVFLFFGLACGFPGGCCSGSYLEVGVSTDDYLTIEESNLDSGGEDPVLFVKLTGNPGSGQTDSTVLRFAEGKGFTFSDEIRFFLQYADEEGLFHPEEYSLTFWLEWEGGGDSGGDVFPAIAVPADAFEAELWNGWMLMIQREELFPVCR
jgi:hypothetical protein